MKFQTTRFKKIPSGLQCIYKLWFADGRFYIGSTINLRSRISTHCSNLKINSATSESRFYRVVRGVPIISVEVIKVMTDIKKMRRKEWLIIQRQKRNVLCLNNVPCVLQDVSEYLNLDFNTC